MYKMASLALCAAMIVINSGYMLVYSATTRQLAYQASTVGMMKTTINDSNSEKAPLYPNAYQIEHDDSEAPQIQATAYLVAATIPQVLGFYEQTLTKPSWSVYEGLPGRSPVTYLWTDATGKSFYRQTLDINAIVWSDKETQVRLTVRRWPDENNIPIYPQAAEIKVHDGIQANGQPERVITYLAQGQTSGLADYYKSTMIQYGWLLEREAQYSLDFVSFPLKVDKGAGASVTVNLTTGPNSGKNEERTSVELRILSDNLKPHSGMGSSGGQNPDVPGIPRTGSTSLIDNLSLDVVESILVAMLLILTGARLRHFENR